MYIILLLPEGILFLNIVFPCFNHRCLHRGHMVVEGGKAGHGSLTFKSISNHVTHPIKKGEEIYKGKIDL